MKVLQINNIDTPGRRFNGHDLQEKLNQLGIQCKNMVFDKLGNDPNTIELGNERDKYLRALYWQLEERLSLQCLLFPFGWKIMNHDEFKNSDIVHYHLIHNMFMSLYSFEALSKKKPTVWSIHDIWALTGHCIVNKECEKWKYGCENCPNKELLFPMKEDKANQMWQVKKKIYQQMDIDIVVASDYMKEMVKESPLLSNKRIHKICFGVDLNRFRPLETLECKRNLGIPESHFVISFRAIENGAKGTEYIRRMLEILRPSSPVTILTVNETGAFDRFKNQYNIIELGWINDDDKMAEIYGASDVFLMPSVAETFGLMAIEAMACGKPVIVFDRTALPDITFAPKCGILVRKYDSPGLKEAVEQMMMDEGDRLQRGRLARELAEKYYDVNHYFNQTIALYEEILLRKKET